MQSIVESRVLVRSTNFVGFQNPVGSEQSYESILAQKKLMSADKFHCMSRGLKPQSFYDTKNRLRKKLNHGRAVSTRDGAGVDGAGVDGAGAGVDEE